MVKHGKGAGRKTQKNSQTNTSRKVVVFSAVAIILVIAAGAIYIVDYLKDARIENAIKESKIAIEDPIVRREVGGEKFVAYSEAVSRGDADAARAAYLGGIDKSSAETEKRSRATLCLELFGAAMNLSRAEDIAFASKCVEENGAGVEVLDYMAKSYEEYGDTAKSQEYKKKIDEIIKKIPAGEGDQS